MVELKLYTDPACPFAFSAEPARWRLRWHYGEQLSWTVRMIVLTLEPGEAERLAEGAPNLQRRFHMPIDPRPYARTFSSEPACRAFVAARLYAPAQAEPLLRRLRVRAMLGGLLDEPQLIAAAARDIGLDAAELQRWSAGEDVAAALAQDIAAARTPTPEAHALDDKLSGPRGARRYAAPSYEFSFGGRTVTAPGFQPVEAYEVAIANLAPTLERRPAPRSIEELLRWAGEPLATAEVATLMRVEYEHALKRLRGVAQEQPAGADFYWTLPG